MYIIAIEGREEEGAYAATNEDGTSVLYIFEEEDDALRFAMLLEQDDYPKMNIMHVEEEIIIQACKMHGYEYQVFTESDIVVPPNQQYMDFI